MKMKLKPVKFYTTPGYKGFLFFHSHSLVREKTVNHELTTPTFPNPLDKHRTPTLRLTPTKWPY